MKDQDADAPPPLERRPWIVRMLGPRPAESFAAQAGEVVRRTLWILPCEWLLVVLIVALHLDPSNAGSEHIVEMLERGPLHFIALGVVLVPTLEELIFRWLPSTLSDLLGGRRGEQRWVLGVVMAASFALAHNLSSEAGSGMIEIAEGLYFYKSVPASQFVFGLLLWDLMRRYGLWASAFSHMLHNLVFLSLAYFATGPA